MQSLKQYDVLGLGIAAVDELIYVDQFPPPNDKTPVRRRERQCGGLTMTALVAAARLGARCAYGARLGDDDLSQMVRHTLTQEGIDTTHIVSVPEARPVVSTIIVGSNGTRNIFPFHAAIDGADPEQPAEAVIRSTRVLFVDQVGIPGQIRAAKIARAAGIPVVSDVEREDLTGFDQLLALVDHVISSEDFAARFTGHTNPESMLNGLWSDTRALVAITCGDQGCWFKTSRDGAPQHQAAFPVTVIDTTGCGDVFHGAYAAALAKDVSAAERICFASAAAALKAQQRGGQAGAPTLAQVQAFLYRFTY